MLADYISGITGSWFSTSDPDSDIHTSGGVYATFGDIFLNTSSGKLFYCSQSGTQIWTQVPFIGQVTSLISNIPQADWAQTNSSSSDYIKNKPAARSQSSASRSLNTIFQISSTRDSLVNYSVDVGTSLSLTTGQTGTVYLEIASDSGFTTNVQELGRFLNGNGGTLTVGLALTQNVTGTLSGYVPLAYYVRLRTQNNTGTPTFTYRSGQEILL